MNDEDYELVSTHRWKLKKDKKDRVGYALTRIEGKTVYMHQLILPGFPRVDHWDGNGLDNRRQNLRGCTHQQNLQNQHPRKGRKYKGVSYRKARAHLSTPWKAYIHINGKSIHLGYFRTQRAGAQAYDVAARQAFGEFARLNFAEHLPTQLPSALAA